MPPKKRPPPTFTPEQAARAAEVVQGAVQRFGGSFDELESALGMYMLGRYVGWKVLFLMHSKRTIRKYEQILDIRVRDEFDEEGSESDRSLAYTAAKTLSNFWKIVSGEAKLDLEKDERKHFKA
jgi:hypothetical protein